MSNLSTLPKGDSAWLLRKAIERIMQQISVLETNIGSSTTGNSANTQVIFNDNGTLRGDTGLTYNKTTDTLSVGSAVITGAATISGDLTVHTSTLKVDSTNHRVGIGTASPAAAAKLSVLGTTVVSASDFVNASTWSARFEAAANSQPSGIFLSGLASGGQVVPGSLHVEPVAASSRSALIATYSADSGVGYFAINRFSPSAGTTSQHYKIDDTGVATWSNVGGVAGTAMTLNSTGLGIGATPIGKFDVYNTGSDTTVFIRSDTTRLGQIVFRDNADAGNQGLVRYDHANDRLSFTANGGENLYLLSTGDLSVQTGNVVMATSGKGIDFSAVTGGTGTATANVLNDYEEGTWTIGLAFGGASVGLTTSSNTGRYTKVGRQVTVTGLLVLTSKGSSTGGASVTGLPFSIGNSNDSYPAASLRLNGVSYIGAFQAFGAVNTTLIGFEQISTLGAVTSLTDANFTNASSVIFTLTYTV